MSTIAVACALKAGRRRHDLSACSGEWSKTAVASTASARSTLNCGRRSNHIRSTSRPAAGASVATQPFA